MIVRCVKNRIEEILDSKMREHVSKYVHLAEIGLEVGEDYFVEGIIFREGLPWFYLCEEDDTAYPIPYCSAFFILLDAGIPTDWRLVFNDQIEILPNKWAEFPNFYERLIDGDVDTFLLFEEIRRAKS